MTPTANVQPRASKEQVALKVLERLKETWPEIITNDALAMALKRHLMRLPRRYGLDIHNLEDLRQHMQLLDAAQSTAVSVVWETRGI